MKNSNFYIKFAKKMFYFIKFLGQFDRQKLSLPGSTASQRRATIMSRSSDHINNLRSPKTGFETGFDIGSDYLGSSQLQRRSTPEIVTKIDVEVSDTLRKNKSSIYLSINKSIYLSFCLSSIDLVSIYSSVYLSI